MPEWWRGAAKAALRLIQSNIRKHSIACEYESCHAYLFSQEEKQSKELKEIIESSSKAGLNIKRSDTIPVPLPFLEAAEISGQGKFNPIKYVYGLAAGLMFLIQLRAIDWDYENNDYVNCYSPVMLVSNTCDMSQENERKLNTKQSIFAPLILLDEVLFDMSKELGEVSANNFYSEVKKRRYSNLLYLPKNFKNEKEYVVFLDKNILAPGREPENNY